VHIIGLVTVEDVGHLRLLLSKESDILVSHLTKYTSSAGEQSEKGDVWKVWYALFWAEIFLELHNYSLFVLPLA